VQQGLVLRLWGLILLLILSLQAAQGQPGGLPSPPFVVPLEDLPDGPGVQGGSINFDLGDEPETFNPIIPQGESSRAIAMLLHAGLFEFPNRAAIIEEFKPSQDDREVTLRLRKGLKFSNGLPVSCADIEFTFKDVLFNPDVASPKDIWKVEGQFPQISCLDELTVRIDLPARFLGLYRLLAEYPILPKQLLANAVKEKRFNTAWGIETPPDQIAGLGPFRLRQYIRGQRLVLERNPFYWKVDQKGTQLPYLDQITLSIVRDDSVRVLRYLNGQTHMLRPRPEDIKVILEKGLWIEVQGAGMTDSHVFVFNQDVNKRGVGPIWLEAVFLSVSFRQAMSHVADRMRMISESLFGYGEPRGGPGIEPGFWFDCQNRENFPFYPPDKIFNLGKASQLLDQLQLVDTDKDGIRNVTDTFLDKVGIPRSGLPPEDQRELEFELITVQGSKHSVSDAEIFRDALAQIGVKANVVPVPFNALWDLLLKGRYQVARVDLISDGDPNKIIDIYHSQGRFHFWKYSDAQKREEWQREVDEILLKQKTATADERWKMLCKFQGNVAENVPLIFLYNKSDIFAWRKDQIGNFKGLEGNFVIRYAEYLRFCKAGRKPDGICP
jgi:peptide/nickel transport system substrate-binding protein